MIFVTGVAGFIGFHCAKALLTQGRRVVGVDNLNDYYPSDLKRARLDELSRLPGFIFHACDIADPEGLRAALGGEKPDAILHLAAQAGVRYSIEQPAAYAHSNLAGHLEILELARELETPHTVYASSSSVYGGNTKTPFSEDDPTHDPVSFYGATKKSNEVMSNSYARLYGLPLTGLRFFTVYGPWGRPDMAYWIFAQKIMANQEIQIFNNGRMSRDFTYIDDIVRGVLAALDQSRALSTPITPHRIYNLGNDRPEALMTLVETIETHLGREAQKTFLPMQPGDVERTWADISRATTDLGYTPEIALNDGLAEFCRWFKHSQNS